MKHLYSVLLSAILVSLFSACQKEQNNPIDSGTYSFSLSVLNDDYTEVIPIKGVKASQVASKNNLPSWISDVYLTGGGSIFSDEHVALCPQDCPHLV
ncbi:MAG: hypothetical protein J6Y66_01690 [Bacteroidales bacterium]|nr:hypothetical protein [Bacteroidales bacterium]